LLIGVLRNFPGGLIFCFHGEKGVGGGATPLDYAGLGLKYGTPKLYKFF